MDVHVLRGIISSGVYSKLSIYFNLFLQNSAHFIRGSLILVQIFCNSGIILMKNIPVS